MHDPIIDRLSEYIDGDLSPDERAEVEAHLAACVSCREVVDELRTISSAAAQLPGVLPDRELWNGVALRVSGSAVSAPSAPSATPASSAASAFRRRITFTLPQLAAAGIALMLTSGGLVYLLRPEPPAVTANSAPADPDPAAAIVPVAIVDAEYDGAIADLERTLADGRSRLDPETVRVLEQNLKAIDAAIDQCRRALEADPANSFLNSHLVSARQRKLALLRRATALTTGS